MRFERWGWVGGRRCTCLEIMEAYYHGVSIGC
jgi:hypothetical protein